MFDYTNNPNENRSMSAPEIAMRAREYAKEQALLTESYRAQIVGKGKHQRASLNLVARLLTGLRLF